MIFKRITSFIFSLIMFISCAVGKTEYNFPVTVQGAIFGGSEGDEISLDLKFDSGWITKADNYIYNGNLAAFSAILCSDSYFRAKDVSKGTVNRVLAGSEQDYTQTALLEKLGYTDVRFIETYKLKQYAADTNDSATFVIGYKNIDDEFDSYIIVVRGCFSIGERLSAFDPGCDSESYTALTGEHGEWTNKNYFKGYDTAVCRATEFIGEYMDEHGSESREDAVLLTGHSRGASLANIIGADFENDESIKSFTYTFNSTPVISDSGAKKYGTIFNLFDKNDYYTDPFPFADEHFVRYGRDISINISKCGMIRKKLSGIKGEDDYICLSPLAREEYDNLFAGCFPNRASLYVMKSVTETYNSDEEASARLDELKSFISGLGISDFCSVSDVSENNGKYEIKISYCGAAILFGFAQIQAYGSAAYDAVISLFKDDTAGCRMAEIIFDNLVGLGGAHLLVNGYAMSTSVLF